MSGRESFASLGVYAREDACVRCSTYPDQGPILSVDSGAVCLSVSVAGRDVMPAWGVEFARALLREVQRFAAECERLHAAQHGEPSGDGQDAAGKDAAA